jgi:hypothetical protein
MIVLAVVALALVLAWRRMYGGLWFVGCGAIASLIYTVITFQVNMRNIQSEYGIQTVELATIDWAIPLAGIALLVVAAALKTRPDQPKTPTAVGVRTHSLSGILSWGASCASLILPAFVIDSYATLQGMGFATAVYGMSVALAAGFWETRWPRRLLLSAVVAVLGLPLCETFDAIMIAAIALVSGAVAVGYMPASIKKKWWANVTYRLGRMLVSGGLVIVTAFLHLPTSGRCPGGGGDITEVFTTFAVMTYIPIGGMIAIDGITKFLRRRGNED